MNEWTTEKPTKPGKYLFTRTRTTRWILVEVRLDRQRLVIDGEFCSDKMTMPIDHLTECYWLGPLSEIPK